MYVVESTGIYTSSLEDSVGLLSEEWKERHLSRAACHSTGDAAEKHLVLLCRERRSRGKRFWATVMANVDSTAMFLLLIIIAASKVTLAVGTGEEWSALVALKSGWKVGDLSRATFANWTAGSDPCSGWEYVDCIDGTVTQLNLTNLTLSGELRVEIGELKNLEVLDISENNLRGPLPGSLDQCRNLKYLDISSNPWNMSFPMVLTRMPKLESLYASTSGLTGSIPQQFYGVKTLKYLYLGNNTELLANLDDFSKLTELVNLTTWEVKLTSPVLPNSLSTLRNLEYFNCHDCQLVGGLPPSYGNLVKMREFNLRKNSLTGGIPETFERMKNMTTFRVDSNSLLGPFPGWVFTEWPRLKNLYLSRNQFYGKPYNIAYLETQFKIDEPKKYGILRWDCNYLTGPLPCEAGNPCSNNTKKRNIPPKPLYPELANFVFDPNCYDGASADYLSKVGYCEDHFLDCAQFANLVVEKGICPACPNSQVLKAGSSVANGCVCEISDADNNFPIAGVVGGAVGLCFLFSLILGFVLWKRRKQFAFLDIFNNKLGAEEDWEIPAGVHRFTVEELARITSDFNETFIIGSGGFGKVYSGTLDDGRMVAIKRASAGSLQGHKEFRNEVTLLSRLHHRHLVRLEGFCDEKDFQVLVYEFMKKGNLATHLYGEHAHGQKPEVFTPLPWYKRLEIAYGVAQGLEYIHSFADPPVIHRDVKPSNILLDDHMVAKLADFGISKESPELDTHISTRPAGTAGYLDPEYFLRRHLTTASDVYAFGVVLLELVTGQVAIDHKRDDEYNLVEWAKKRFFTAGIISIIDPLIKNDYSKDAFTQITELALKCASFNKSGRPTMKEALAVFDPLMVPKASKSASSSRADSSFSESDWLLAKRDLYHKYDLETSTDKDTMSLPSTGSTYRSLDVTEEFGPR